LSPLGIGAAQYARINGRIKVVVASTIPPKRPAVTDRVHVRHPVVRDESLGEGADMTFVVAYRSARVLDEPRLYPDAGCRDSDRGQSCDARFEGRTAQFHRADG
jgi:hypothetical protein